MRLIVKGTLPQAFAALACRDIKWTSIRRHPVRDEVHVITPDDQATEYAVMGWFGEAPLSAPFPPGACLFYQLSRSVSWEKEGASCV